MPLPIPPIAEPAVSSRGRLGTDARSAVSSLRPAERASETVDQSDAWAEDVVRRHFGDPAGLGLGFAEPGEMERRAGDELWPDGGSTAATIAVTVALIGLVALATALVMGWVS